MEDKWMWIGESARVSEDAECYVEGKRGKVQGDGNGEANASQADVKQRKFFPPAFPHDGTHHLA